MMLSIGSFASESGSGSERTVSLAWLSTPTPTRQQRAGRAFQPGSLVSEHAWVLGSLDPWAVGERKRALTRSCRCTRPNQVGAFGAPPSCGAWCLSPFGRLAVCRLWSLKVLYFFRLFLLFLVFSVIFWLGLQNETARSVGPPWPGDGGLSAVSDRGGPRGGNPQSTFGRKKEGSRRTKPKK